MNLRRGGQVFPFSFALARSRRNGLAVNPGRPEKARVQDWCVKPKAAPHKRGYPMAIHLVKEQE